ncbi:MAG: Fic/DOC family protein [Janthinobacterium lividum]
MGHYTDAVEDNLLGLTTKQEINEAEGSDVLRAETWITELDYPLAITTTFLLDLHRVAFAHLYEWAGKWRTTTPNVGSYLPPLPSRLPQLLYEFEDDLRFRMAQMQEPSAAAVADLLAFAHHKLVFIHPFTNGNGRTARLLTNALAYNYGYDEVLLYQREASDSRKKYLQAIQLGDNYDLSELKQLILQQLMPLALS